MNKKITILTIIIGLIIISGIILTYFFQKENINLVDLKLQKQINEINKKVETLKTENIKDNKEIIKPILNGIIYKPERMFKDGYNNNYIREKKLIFKNFYQNEEEILISKNTDSALLHNNENIYYTEYDKKKLTVYKFSIKSQKAEAVYTNTFSNEIQSTELKKAGNNKIAILVNSGNKESIGQPDGIIYQSIYLYDINTKNFKKIYDQKNYWSSTIIFLTINENNLYLSKSSFEGLNSLIKIDLINKKEINLSTKLNFGVSKAKVSPNGKYIALSTLTRNKDYKSINKLSFYNTKNDELLHSDLEIEVGGEFPGTLSDISYILWDDDSSFVYVATGLPNNYFEREGYPIDTIYKKTHYYFIDLDGQKTEKDIIKKMEKYNRIVKIFNKDLMLVVNKIPSGFKKEKSLLDQNLNLSLLNLNNQKIQQILLEKIIFGYDYFVKSFVGVVK